MCGGNLGTDNRREDREDGREREASGRREKCERESGDREEAPRKEDLIEPRPKEEKLNEAGLRSGENTAAIRGVYAESLTDGRYRGRREDEEGTRKDGRSNWTGCKLKDRRGQERAAVEYGCLVDADVARSAGGGDGDNIRARQRERLKEKRGGNWVIEEGGRQESLLKKIRRLEENMKMNERGGERREGVGKKDDEKSRISTRGSRELLREWRDRDERRLKELNVKW